MMERPMKFRKKVEDKLDDFDCDILEALESSMEWAKSLQNQINNSTSNTILKDEIVSESRNTYIVNTQNCNHNNSKKIIIKPKRQHTEKTQLMILDLCEVLVGPKLIPEEKIIEQKSKTLLAPTSNFFDEKKITEKAEEAAYVKACKDEVVGDLIKGIYSLSIKPCLEDWAQELRQRKSKKTLLYELKKVVQKDKRKARRRKFDFNGKWTPCFVFNDPESFDEKFKKIKNDIQEIARRHCCSV